MAERRGMKGAPVAAVDQYNERASFIYSVGPEEVDRLARMVSVAETQFGVVEARSAIGRCVALPSRDDLRMLRNAGAVIVFRLVVDGRQPQTSSSASASPGMRTGR